MKIATVKFEWDDSVSTDIETVEFVLIIAGTEQSTIIDRGVKEFVVDINANTSGTFKIIYTDKEGLVAVSMVATFTIGDLEKPLPATNLRWSIIGVHDSEEP